MQRSSLPWWLVPASTMLSGCLLLSEPPPLVDDASNDPAPIFGWLDVAARSASACALQEDGSLWCGADPRSLQLNDEGPFVALSQGYSSSVCGVHTDGWLFCDGLEGYFTLDGPFLNVSGGGEAGCGLDSNGEAQCWPESNEVAGPFLSVGAGDRFACGIRQDTGGLRCWGIDTVVFDEALTQVPEGAFRQVATLGHAGCAVTPNGPVRCWGDGDHGLLEGPPANTYVQLSLSEDVGCAVTDAGAVECWGENSEVFEAQIPQDGIEYALIDLAPEGGGCGIDRSSQLHCW